jgi:hypothetical protein
VDNIYITKKHNGYNPIILGILLLREFICGSNGKISSCISQSLYAHSQSWFNGDLLLGLKLSSLFSRNKNKPFVNIVHKFIEK